MGKILRGNRLETLFLNAFVCFETPLEVARKEMYFSLASLKLEDPKGRKKLAITIYVETDMNTECESVSELKYCYSFQFCMYA